MITVEMETHPPDLIKRLESFPGESRKAWGEARRMAMDAVHEAVPPYSKYPESKFGRKNSYKRTGALGRSLGKDMKGKKLGEPSIFMEKSLSPMTNEALIGSNTVNYINQVVGNEQGYPWRVYWWTHSVWMKKSTKGILKAYKQGLDKIMSKLGGGF